MFFSVGRGGMQRAGSGKSGDGRHTTRRATPRYRPELVPLEDRLLLSTVTVQVGPGGANTFSPAAVTVNVGDTVHWVWGSDFHSTTSGPCSAGTCTADGKWDSGIFNAPHAFNFTFTSPGTFPYYCIIHSDMGMTGSVTVVGAPSPVPGAPAVTQLTPARAGALKRHLTLTVFGNNFNAGAVVRVNGHPLATTFSGGGQLQVANFLEQVRAAFTVRRHGPPRVLFARRRLGVTVLNPDGNESAAVTFVVRPVPGVA
jgi:plastocyanin